LAFFWFEEVDEFANSGPKALDGSLSSLAQERFQLGEGVFDGVEVWAVGREIEELRAGGFYYLSHIRAFVTWQVIHNDDVALAQFGQENFFDIGLEGEAVDRPINYERRDEPAQRQRSDERRRFPVAMRNADPQPFTTPTSAVAARHVGRGPGFVDEDQALGIEVELSLEPAFAPLGDIGTILLRGVGRLFLRVMAWRTKKRWIVPKPKTRSCALSA